MRKINRAPTFLDEDLRTLSFSRLCHRPPSEALAKSQSLICRFLPPPPPKMGEIAAVTPQGLGVTVKIADPLDKLNGRAAGRWADCGVGRWCGSNHILCPHPLNWLVWQKIHPNIFPHLDLGSRLPRTKPGPEHQVPPVQLSPITAGHETVPDPQGNLPPAAGDKTAGYAHGCIMCQDIGGHMVSTESRKRPGLSASQQT